METDSVESFFGLDFKSVKFTFATACASPKQFFAREGGHRGAKGAFISSAKSAARATKPFKGKLVWQKPADHITSNDLKRWAADNGLPELSPHALLQLGSRAAFGIYCTHSAEKLYEQPGMGGMSDTLTARMKSFCSKKDVRSNDVVMAHATAVAAFNFNFEQ